MPSRNGQIDYRCGNACRNRLSNLAAHFLMCHLETLHFWHGFIRQAGGPPSNFVKLCAHIRFCIHIRIYVYNIFIYIPIKDPCPPTARRKDVKIGVLLPHEIFSHLYHYQNSELFHALLTGAPAASSIIIDTYSPVAKQKRSIMHASPGLGEVLGSECFAVR